MNREVPHHVLGRLRACLELLLEHHEPLGSGSGPWSPGPPSRYNASRTAAIRSDPSSAFRSDLVSSVRFGSRLTRACVSRNRLSSSRCCSSRGRGNSNLPRVVWLKPACPIQRLLFLSKKREWNRCCSQKKTQSGSARSLPTRILVMWLLNTNGSSVSTSALFPTSSALFVLLKRMSPV